MIALMLDACCVIHLDEPARDGPVKAHGLNAHVGEKIQETLNTLFARACAPNCEAADSGKHATNKGTVMLSLICLCAVYCNVSDSLEFLELGVHRFYVRISFLLQTGVYRDIVLQHLPKPNQDVHVVFRHIGRAVFLATGGAQSPVRQPSATTLSRISYSRLMSHLHVERYSHAVCGGCNFGWMK